MSSNSLTTLSYAARRELIDRALPLYREASLAQKGLLLDRMVAMTGYARKYAIHLLNQAPTGKRTIHRRRQPRYGSQVQHILLLAWKAAKYICAKHLIPFLPTLVAALERHGYLQLSEENRSLLLQMSTTTAECLLRSHRPSGPRGLCTTQAGSLLKHHIPIRTFHGWDNAHPGFLEADLVAHNGGDSEGCSLYTFSLTDVATGWTECLPLLYKSPEAVLVAFQQARVLFPFPILGLDTDNGSEFINETLRRYCETEQITFTRGRPHLKDDQCYIEQKNRAVVRQFVGFARFAGYQAFRQLRELYRALRLYVNCFQPSMKLLSKHREGETVHRIYDPAKTPLQRVLLSEIVPTTLQQHLHEVAQALDPLRLLRHLEDLQQALSRCAIHLFPLLPTLSSAPLLPFCVERCLPGTLSGQKKGSDLTEAQHLPQDVMDVLDWLRTTKDPFEGVWEIILSCVLAHPEWSGNDLFQEVQRLFPGRFLPSQQSTLQLGLRKIRARLLEIMHEPWPHEVIQASLLTSSEPQANQQEADVSPTPLDSSAASFLWAQAEASGGEHQPTLEDETTAPHVPPIPVADEPAQQFSNEERQHPPELQIHHLTMTIEGAIEAYLQEQKNAGHRRKTLEWHQTALGFLQQYLMKERHLTFLSQITESEVRSWLAFLRTTSTVTGTPRRASTIATYGRSARAFCHWGVRNGYLQRTPLTRGILPKGGKKHLHLIEPDVFERLLLVCRPEGAIGVMADRTAARNRAILWILMDTGMRASELCGLRLSDVNREQRTLRVEGRGHERWLPLSPNAWYQVLSYLELHRPKKSGSEGKETEEEPLFLSETSEPFSINALTLLFDRLRKRAGMNGQHINPSQLRDTFALRYIRAGGEQDALRELLGLRGKTALTRYEQVSTKKIEHGVQKEHAEELPHGQQLAPHTRKQRRKRSSSVATSKHQQRDARTHDGIVGKESAIDAKEDS